MASCHTISALRNEVLYLLSIVMRYLLVVAIVMFSF